MSVRSCAFCKAPFQRTSSSAAQIQQAIKTGRITTVGLVELYLKRIKAYNGSQTRPRVLP